MSLVATWFLLLLAVPEYAAGMDEEQMKTLCTEKKDADQCFALGEHYRVVDLNNKAALEYFILGCGLEHMTSCVHAGILTERNGIQNSAEWKQAADFYQKACDQHHDKGCFNMGMLKFKEGRAKKAMELFQLACDYGNSPACSKLKSMIK